jgi:Mn2+/Fe2+ NRAMP family transporter
VTGANEKAEGKRQAWRWASFGPGLLVMLADTDAGNVIAAAQAGATTRYALLPFVLALAPALYLIQELAARLGLFTGLGFGAAVRENFGRFWAGLALAGLVASALATLVTEFSGLAGIGELFGLSREVTLPAVSLLLLVVVVTGAYRRIEQVALVLALAELAFLVVAWRARPDAAALARDLGLAHDPKNLAFLGAAIVGAVFNPWMIFYQQAATARKKLRPEDLGAVRFDTAAGALLTQVLTAAVLVAAAATFSTGEGLDSVAAIARTLSASLGPRTGEILFGLGVVGASLAAAIVASLALSWGVSETLSPHRDHAGLFDNWAALGLYALAIAGSAEFVRVSGNLVLLNLCAQAANAALFPITAGLLVALAAKVSGDRVLRGAALWTAGLLVVAVAMVTLAGAVMA